MKRSRIKRRLRGRGHRDEREGQNQVAADTVIFVHCLGVIHAAEQGWRVELRDSHQTLDDQHNVGDEAADAVRRDEVVSAVGEFVVFDHDHAAD